MKDIIIFDLDGTLALIDHRRYLVEKKLGKPDWDKFYDMCDQDSPNQPVIEVFSCLQAFESWDIYIFSGRSEVVRQKTTDWLHTYGIFVHSDHLLMRPDKDYTPDEELKKKWLEQIGGPDRVFCCFDDRQKVVDMWRWMGITCFQVAPGNF